MALPVDYYRLLSVTRDVDDISLKKAYQRASLQSHPIKNKSENPAALKKQFELIAEAYDVLSDRQF